MPIRLLFFQQSSIFENYGGVEFYQHDLLSLLAEQGQWVKSILPLRHINPSAESPSYPVVKVKYPKQGIIQKTLNRFPLSLFREGIKAIRKESIKPDFLVCGHVSLGPMVWLLSRLTGIPFVTIVYGIECWGNLLPHDEAALRAALGILSISHWTKDILLQRGFLPSSIMIVPPTIHPSFEALPPPSREVPNLPFRLLTISRLDPRERYKGHEDVLAALRLILDRRPDFNFSYLIVGKGKDRARLQNRCRELNLQNNVTFQEAVESRSDLIALYQSCSLFLMPSHFGREKGRWVGEGFGIVFVEAGLCGVPSLAYQCGGATDIIEPYRTGLLAAVHNVEALSHLIEYSFDHPTERMKWGENAYYHMKKNFTRNAVAKRLEDLPAFLRERFREISPDSNSLHIPSNADRIT